MRALVVDDSTIFRKVVRDALSEIPGVEIAGVATDGESALQKIERLKPDLVTLDIEMPGINGIQVLQRLGSSGSKPTVIMLSALTTQGATATIEAIRHGAFDFVLKPSHQSLELSRQQLVNDLRPKVQAVFEKRKALVTEATVAPEVSQPLVVARTTAKPRDTVNIPKAKFKPAIIVIGVSTGGPAALSSCIPQLPADLPVPVAIVQHMPPVFTQSLANELNRASRLTVTEAVHGESLLPGHVYIAPGGKQFKVGRVGSRSFAQVTDDPAEEACKPSVNYLFRSVAHGFGQRALAVILTGMGSDGKLGCQLLKRKQCTVIAQDEATCVVYGMPKQIVDAGLADYVAPLHEIPGIICQHLS